MAVLIKQKARNKIYAYCKQAKHGEIGGLILGKLENTGDITVKNVILLNQVRTNSNFEIDDESMMEFTKNASDKVLKSVIGWWHYHLNFGTFWSGDDSSTFTRLTQLSNFCLGLVATIPLKGKIDDMEMRCRLDMYNREGDYVSMDGIEYDIEKTFHKVNWGSIKTEVQGFVKDDDRIWVSCPRCRGHGIVEADRKKQGKNTQLVVDDYGYDELSKEEQQMLDEMGVGGFYGYGG